MGKQPKSQTKRPGRIKPDIAGSVKNRIRTPNKRYAQDISAEESSDDHLKNLDKATKRREPSLKQKKLANSAFYPNDTTTYYHVDDTSAYPTDNFSYLHSDRDYNYLFLANIAAIGQMGVMTTVPLEPGFLTDYQGTLQTYSMYEDATDRDYFFMLREDEKNETVIGIDAKHSGNWARMVNGTDAHLANISVHVHPHRNRISYHVKKKIHAGEQLLIDYGEDFKFEQKCFLKPQDTWRDSQDIYNDFHTHYDVLTALPKELIKHLQLPPKKYVFYGPSSAAQKSKKHVDLPILIKIGRQFIHQNKTENITALMLAAWRGDNDKITELIKSGANPNMQCSHSGLTPLHFALLNPTLSIRQKLSILHCLLAHQADINLHDSKNQTAIESFIKAKENNSLALKTFLTELISSVNIQENEFALAKQLALLLLGESELNEKDRNAIISSLYQMGLPKSCQFDEENTLLHLAILKGNNRLVERLLAIPNSIEFFNFENNDSLCPILCAISTGNIEIIEQLLPFITHDDLAFWAEHESEDVFTKALQILLDDASLSDKTQMMALDAINNYLKESKSNTPKWNKEVHSFLDELIRCLDTTAAQLSIDTKITHKQESSTTNRKSQKRKHPESMFFEAKRAEANDGLSTKATKSKSPKK